MPFADPVARALPYQSDRDDPAGNTSRAGAELIAPDARSIRAAYVRLLYRCGAAGVTDLEAADTLRIQRTTLIPRRHELGAHVRWTGRFRSHVVRGRSVRNKAWALSALLLDAPRVVHIPEAPDA